MKRSIGALVAVSLCGAASVASAQGAPQAKQIRDSKRTDAQRGESSDALDSHGVPAAAGTGVDDDTIRLFEALDRDDNGRVSRQELWASVSRHISSRVAYRFQQLDRDNDGRVTRREVMGMKAERFARFDRNQDGSFTLAELGTVMISQATDRLAELMTTLDSDGDQACTYAELNMHRQTRIAARDQKHNTAKPTEEVATAEPQETQRPATTQAKVAPSDEVEAVKATF